MEPTKAWEVSLSKLVAKTWLNDELYKRFLNEPATILREAGLMLEQFVEATVIQNLNNKHVLRLTGAEGGTIYDISLPSKPSGLADEQISAWAENVKEKVSAIPKCC